MADWTFARMEQCKENCERAGKAPCFTRPELAAPADDPLYPFPIVKPCADCINLQIGGRDD